MNYLLITGKNLKLLTPSILSISNNIIITSTEITLNKDDDLSAHTHNYDDISWLNDNFDL